MGTLTGVGLNLSILKEHRGKCRSIEVIVRSVCLCSRIGVTGGGRPKVALAAGLGFLPAKSNGVTCGTTRLLVSRFSLGRKIRVALGGRVPMTTNLTKKDSGTTTILFKVGQLFKLRLARRRLVRHKIGLKTSIPCYVVHKAILTRKVKRRLDILPTVPGYAMLVTGPPVDISAGVICRTLSSGRVIRRPSVSKVLRKLQGKSLRGITSSVKGILRSIAVPVRPIVTSVGRIVRSYKTVKTVVDKDKPAIFNLFRGQTSTERTRGVVQSGNLAERTCMAGVRGIEEGWGKG